MVRVRISFEGAGAAAQALRELDRTLNQPAAPLLAALGQAMVTAFQANIRTEGSRLSDRGISWPTLHRVTVKIREFYGHGRGPRLIRSTGDLLRSINVLDVGESFVEAGSSSPHARTLHQGGPWTDPKTGRTRQVQAFPFIIPSQQDVDDLVEQIADFFLPVPGGAGA